MSRFALIVLLANVATATRAVSCWQPRLSAEEFRVSVTPPHPRLRINDAKLAELNRTIQVDATARQYFEGLRIVGTTMLSDPVVDCSSGADLFPTRTVLIRQYALGLLWRLTGDDRFAERGTQDLLHVTTNCSTWDPFGLVLAEMTHAVGIGFDWLYQYLTPAQRSTIIAGITKLGFEEALDQYAQGIWWADCTFNWGMVTNGGLAAGAAAFLEHAPNVTGEVLSHALAGIPCSFESFAPDGGWHEGAMYWQYTAEYAQAATEALRGTYGHDFGLTTAPGFNETGLFRLHMNGPSQNGFDYGDDNALITNSAAGYFMGYSAVPTTSESVSSLFAWEARNLARLIAEDGSQMDCSKLDCARLLIDFSSAGSYDLLEAQPRAKVFRLSAFNWDNRAAVGFFRSAWSAEASGVAGKEAWLGFKAANGVPNHNDLDGGTFVFEVGGQRWASEMGTENYDLPGYWNQKAEPNKRYSWYRKSTAGHNTLTFNSNELEVYSSDQDPGVSGITEISLFEHDGATSPGYAIVNLTAAYAAQGAVRVERGFAFTPDFEQLLVVDEVDFASAENVTWSMHTTAGIEIDGAAATLSLGGVELRAMVIEPSGALFSSARIDLKPPQNPSDGLSKLMVQVPVTGSPAIRIVVGLSLNAAPATPALRPLAAWPAEGPFAEKGDVVI